MQIDQSNQNEARLSRRAVAALEIISVISSVLITAWVLNPLQLNQRWLEALPGILALALMMYSHWLHGETPQVLGFTGKHFFQALRLIILPMIVVGALLILIGYRAHSLNFGERFWLSLLVVPFWGLTQQYILQGFIYRRLQRIFPTQNSYTNILIAAVLFALVHAPNFPLMFLTLIGGIVWTWVYERAPNLFVLGLSHGIMSAVAMCSLPPWFLQSMSIGYKHLIFQKF
jgi:membrane protease YdiL (CAAX protease family)